MRLAGHLYALVSALVFVVPTLGARTASESVLAVSEHVAAPAVGQEGTRVRASRKFAMKKTRLAGAIPGMPVLEAKIRFDAKQPDLVRDIPGGLAQVEYASILLTATARVGVVRGRTGAGTVVVFVDRDTDSDLSDEAPVVFDEEDGVRTGRLSILYRDLVGGRETPRSADLVLTEPKPGNLEYHFDEVWQTTLSYGGEQLNVALQRLGMILFLDANGSGAYEKVFYPERETLGIGGKFFRLEADRSSEKMLITETDRQPVDAGHPAPDFEAHVWRSDSVFKLSEHKGEIIVLTFWSPQCPGSKHNATLFDALARSFTDETRVRFIAVINDAKVLEAFLEDHEHSFTHVVDTTLWDTYGVVAPFPTFVIDGRGTIVTRQWGFTPGLEDQLRTLLRSR